MYVIYNIYLEWNIEQRIEINRSKEIKKMYLGFFKLQFEQFQGVQSVCCVYPEGERSRKI